MARVAPGVQIADRHRLDPLAAQGFDRGVERGAIERRLDPAVGAHPLAHAEAQPARHQLLRRRQAQVVAVVLQPFAHFDDIAMALCRQQPDPRTVAFDERVGRDRGAVHDPLGPRQHRRRSDAQCRRQAVEPIDDAERRIGRGRRHLGEGRAARLVDRDEIGEGAADIDADPVQRHSHFDPPPLRVMPKQPGQNAAPGL